MKVMMLGWEYPPLISGGLATASEGLTHALSAQGVDIDFVLPRTTGREDAAHMAIFSCNELKDTNLTARASRHPALSDGAVDSLIGSLYSSYARPENSRTMAGSFSQQEIISQLPPGWATRDPVDVMTEVTFSDRVPGMNDPLFKEVTRYAREIAQTTHAHKFDLVHAHDWMTYPAGVLLAKAFGVPFVAHVHSLEYDRCGDGGNRLIHAIENFGIRAADRVIAVSEYTRQLVCRKLGISPERVSVAHNGVKQSPDTFTSHLEDHPDQPKRVLFLGRVTYQKGPDVFVEAAARVLEHRPNVVFVLAGNGDMLAHVREHVQQLGIEKNFEFPGFVTGQKLDDQFSRADLYVMPSVSEPFGIAPLEALARGTPALISKQSGVSEVLSHVLKSDFWDVRKMADFILNALENPELGRSMMAMSQNEVKRLRWENTARDVLSTYKSVLHNAHPAEAC